MSKKEGGPTFTKQQFLKSSGFTAEQKDLLNALLENDIPYTRSQVNDIIKNFLNMEAK